MELCKKLFFLSSALAVITVVTFSFASGQTQGTTKTTVVGKDQKLDGIISGDLRVSLSREFLEELKQAGAGSFVNSLGGSLADKTATLRALLDDGKVVAQGDELTMRADFNRLPKAVQERLTKAGYDKALNTVDTAKGRVSVVEMVFDKKQGKLFYVFQIKSTVSKFRTSLENLYGGNAREKDQVLSQIAKQIDLRSGGAAISGTLKIASDGEGEGVFELTAGATSDRLRVIIGRKGGPWTFSWSGRPRPIGRAFPGRSSGWGRPSMSRRRSCSRTRIPPPVAGTRWS